MPILSVPVSLGEVLENSAPLREADIWGVLCQGAEAIQDLFFRGEAVQNGIASFVISLDTLLLCPNGRAQLSESSQTKNVSTFIAPEIHTGILMSEAAIEKIYVYSLGKTLQVAIDYSLKKDPSLTISRNLESLLNAMCEKNPSLRIALIHVLEACSLQSQRRTVTRTPSFSQSVARLAKTVTGTQIDLSYWSYDYYNSYNNSGSSSDQSRQSTLNRRSLKSRRASRRNRRRNGSGRSHKEKDRSRSRSPATSSSRSRSRSYSNAGNVENVDPKDDKYTDTSSTSSQSMIKTCHVTASPKRKPSINSRPSSLHILPNSTATTVTNSASQARSDTSQSSFSSSSSSKHRRSPSSIFGAKADLHLANTPAYEKYLRLKDRQRKLQALQKTPTDETGFWGSDNSDVFSDTRSVTSGISIMQDEADHCPPRSGNNKNVNSRDHWSFLPDLSSGYGQDMALKLGPRGSDRDSIVSSEMSFFQHDPNAMRSEIDPTPLYAAPSLKSMTEQALHHSNIHPAPYSQVPRSPSSSILSSLGDERVTGNKEYNGPEFICRGRKPLIKLNMLLSGESAKNPANARRVIIVLLNGQKLEVMCDPSTTGKQLFQTIISHMALHEIQSYFGLTYIYDGEHFFLDQDTKLHKVAPDGWREGGKGYAAITFILFFRIKYYGTSILDTNHQHLLYLQLRQDILEERLECDENRALSLAAFALQVECGDYQKELMGRNYFVPEYYFSKRILQLYGTGFIRDHTPDAHRSINGLSQDDAMAKFIRLVQELPEYGTHFHKVYKTKNENPNNISWIGIGAHSMIIAENLKKERVIVERQPWAMVDKLSFKGKRITVQVKPDPTVGGKPLKVYFYTNSHRKGRYLLQMSTDQHKFQLKICSQSHMMSALQSNKPLPEPPMFADIEFADLEEEDEDEMYQLSSPVSQLPTEDHKVPVQLSGSTQKPIYHHSSSNLHDSLASVLHPTKPSHHLLSSVHSLDTLTPMQLSARLHAQKGTLGAVRLTGSSPSLLSPPSSLHVKYSKDNHYTQLQTSLSPVPPFNFHSSSTNAISSTSHILDFNDHSGLSNGANFVSLKEVVLKKDSSSSIGISFVAGSIPGIYKNGTNGSRQRKQTFSLPAIFVKSLTPGGPADLNGHIKPNDQILAVNGSTVTGLCCQDVIEQINKHNHSTPVQLLLLQRSHKTPNKQSVPPTSNKPNTKLPTSPSHKNCTLPTDQSWSRSANDFISRTLPTSRRHSPGSTLNYFNDHYIPEHHISVPDMLDTLQETKATSTRFSTSILSGSLSSLQECKRQKIVSTRGIHCNFMEKQTGIVPFHNINRLSIPEIPQFKLTLPPSPSLPTFMPYNNQKCSLEFLSTPLASSTPASSPTTQRNARGGHHCMSLTSAKQLLSSKSKQTIFREKPGSIWKQRQNEIFYECFLSKKDGSLGLNIIGGIDTKTELGGVYVKSLRPNGAAEKNGIIKADDRIIQINSINLEEVQHEEAVSLLQDAPIRCLLLLGRKPCNHKPVSHCPPMAIDNGMVPAQDTNQREFLKEETETNRKLAAEVQSNCKHGKLSQEFSLLEAGSEKDRNHREIDLAVSQEKDRTFPKRTICDKSEKKLATLELLSPESHGVQQGKKTKPVGTRTRAEMKAPNNVENIHTGASPTSEDLQCKDNVHFPPQKYDGATKNEGYFRQGPKQDPTLSDGRNGNTLNKVTGNNPDRGKHFENNASLHSGPSDSAVIPAEEQRELHEKDDSPIIQRTAHGSDSSNCSSGGILTEDTSNSDQAKKILMALKQKEYGEAVLLGKDFVECQLESASRRNPMSLSANMANESSTQQVSDPKRANPNDKSGGSSMQQYLSSNKSKFSNETKKADRSVAEIKDETLLQLSLKNNQQPIISRSKLVSSESANDNISENLALNPKLDTSNQEKDKISESLSSSRMEKIPQSISLKSGPTSDIQDDPYKDPLKNLSWLWDVPLVRSPEVTNHDLLRQLLLQLEKSLHSKKYLEDFQLIKQDCFSNAGRTKVALLPENKSKNRSQEYLPYDNSRVLLSGRQSYINASHIKLDIGKMKYHYIACQSPLSNTVVDFWRMVWETKAPSIVMLSHQVELGRNKCFKYWPDSKDKPWDIEEKYQVALIERHHLPGFDARLLQLSCQSSGKQHQVMQFMYKAWPFRGTPSSPVSLLQLVQAVQFYHEAAEYHQTSNAVKCPVVIHCANGCGRSAVFIAVYTALLHIQNNVQLDIFALVKNLRLQRPRMVETQAEYKFCYTAVLRALYELFCPYGELVTENTHAGQ